MSQPTPAARSADVVVIGGGLHGCSAALHLALRGKRVTVLEKNTVGRHASGVNAGGVRRLGRHLAEIPLSVAALEIWQRIETLVGDDCGFRTSGQVKLAESEADLAILETRAKAVCEAGFTHEEMIEPREARRLVPAAAPHIRGGLVARADGHADPYRTTMAFKARGEAEGVAYFEHTRAVGIDRRGDLWSVHSDAGRFEAPVLVNCAGAWADRVAAWLDEPVPLEARGLMLMVTARVPHFNDPVVGLTSRALSFKQTASGTVVIGGALETPADREAETTTIDLRRVARSARTVSEVFPHLRSVPILRCWAGIEGFMPDGLPVLGPSARHEGLFHAFGFSAHGFQLGPISGRLIAELVTRGRTNLPIAGLRIDRFAAPQPAP
jgi:sarcosine oxidase, subunit beta